MLPFTRPGWSRTAPGALRLAPSERGRGPGGCSGSGRGAGHEVHQPGQRPASRRSVVPVGSLPQRAAVGHGPGGLQRRRRGVDVLPHDHARSQAYRWGEDGLAGFSDVEQRLCVALGLWNGRDPILKERAFGLTGGRQPWRGRQGLLVVPRRGPRATCGTVALSLSAERVPLRGAASPRTPGGAGWTRNTSCSTLGVFDEDRYWVVEVDYAKADPDDLLITVEVTNAGPDTATLHVLPTALVPQHLGVGRAVAPVMVETGRGRSRSPTRSSVSWSCWPARPPTAPSPRCSSARTRPNPARLYGAGRPALSQGRHQRPRRARRRHGQPGARGHKCAAWYR